MIEVRKGEEGIEISFPYNLDYSAKIKTIEGYRWYPEEKCWSVPYFEFETLSSVSNSKHKAILMLVYSSGLRVSEVVKLKPEDIDAGRRLIYVRGGKGRKDRYTLLSAVAMESLRDYSDKYKPVKWLFLGARKEKHISTRTIQAIFEHAREKAGIEKDV